MDQLLREFITEAEELVEVLAGDLEVLRARRHDGPTRRELVARIFRHIHTLKGSSASLELASITELSHEFETVLDSVRLGRMSLDEAVLNTLDEAVTAISHQFRVVAKGQQPAVPGVLVDRLRGLKYKSERDVTTQSSSTQRKLTELPEKIAGKLNAHERQRLQEAMNEGAEAFKIDVNFDLETFDVQFKELTNALNQCGELISSLPGESAASPEQVSFQIVLVSLRTVSQLTERLTSFAPIEVTELCANEDQAATAIGEDPSHPDESWVEVPLSIAPLTPLVRIDLTEIDQLITTTREIFSDTKSALELASSIDNASQATAADLRTRTELLRRRFEELEEALSGLRVVSLDRTLTRAVRAGTVVARATGKEIDFDVKGGNVRLDKSIVDAIADPLLHILRNAVDHGIESPGERRSNGKSPRGRIKLEVSVAHGRMRLRVSDDGRGIDPKRVARAAVDRGIIEKNTEVSVDESLRIIFAPGFSTAEVVSSVSGRGVGLDIVARALEHLDGKIEVQSEVGIGTTFDLLLPYSSALLHNKMSVSQTE